MKDIIGAMAEEKSYQRERLNGIDSSLSSRIVKFGYDNLTEYFEEKRKHLFNAWRPEVYRIPLEDFAEVVEDAIISEKYGIYIPVCNGLYAYHGDDDIDYDECRDLNLRIVELKYRGGTIVGSGDDFSIEIIMPSYIGLDSGDIITKISDILSACIDGVEISGNDILVNGKKVMGSMERLVGNVYVWAAQISFGEYDQYIERVCKKKSKKKPSKIDRNKLTRDRLEHEVISWLQKR